MSRRIPRMALHGRSLSLAFLGVVLCLSLSGCAMVYRFNSAALYEVKASTEAGALLLETCEVKVMCERTYGLFWADFFISRNCTYAIVTDDDVTGQISGSGSAFERKVVKALALKGTKVRYVPIDKSDVDRLGLEPDFSWWDRYGFLCVSVLMYLAFVCINKAILDARGPHSGVPAWMYAEEMMRYNARDWRCYAYHCLMFMFFVFPVVVIIRCLGLWL